MGNFKDIFSKYKTYDTSKGFGSVDEWSKAFDDRMGIDEANKRVGDDNPLSIMGLTALPATADILKSVYRKLMLKNQEAHRHDATADAQEKLKKIIAAYTVLLKRIQR